jgi:23S rRNA pseudouridine2605 synthase
MLGKKFSGHFTGSNDSSQLGKRGIILTAEQLQAARAAHWRQKQNPLLTLEDAERWLEQHPLCLYLPRRAQLTTPAPSFVEACMGTAQATPGAAAIEQAQGWLTRLVAGASVVALNLLGAVSEQPDFLAHKQALPYVLCLRADADWKHEPQKSSGHKVSPLVLELWRALDKEGVLSAAQAKETLGRELTEAAILRGLSELWQGLRISPVYGDAGQPAQWELLRVRHREALMTAAGTSQVTALSLLVSMYLQSVFAASSEEIEIFLSPVASRSRVREAVRGLSATGQIHSLSMDTQTYYFLEDGLREFAAPAVPPAERMETPGPVAPATAPPLQAQRGDRLPNPVRPVRPAAALGRPEKPAQFAPKPGAGSSPTRAEWIGPRRPTQRPGRPGAFRPDRSRDKQPSRPPGRSFPPGTAGEPRTGAGVPRSGPRPDQRGRVQPDTRPGKRAAGGGGTEERVWAARWARTSAKPGGRPGERPGEGSASAPRPGQSGRGGPSPFRERPKPRFGSGGERKNRPDGDRASRPFRGRFQSLEEGRRSEARPSGNRPPGNRPPENRPWMAKRPPGRPKGSAVPFRSGPNRTGSAGVESGPVQGPARGFGGGQGRDFGRSRRDDRPRPGGGPSGAHTRPERGGQGPRPPFKGSARPSTSRPRASSGPARPGGKRGGKPGRQAGKPAARFRGGKPNGKKPGT